MATLIINRTSEWMNRTRNIQLILNGEKIETIGDGASKEIYLPAGHHQLLARIDWCGSRPLDLNISEDEKIFVTISGFKQGKWVMPLFLGLVFLSLIMVSGFGMNPNYVSLITVPFIVYIVYFLTLGSNDYLTLQEVKQPEGEFV